MNRFLIVLVFLLITLTGSYTTTKYRILNNKGEISVDMLDRTIDDIYNNFQPKSQTVLTSPPGPSDIGGEGYEVFFATCTEFVDKYVLINGTTYYVRYNNIK